MDAQQNKHTGSHTSLGKLRGLLKSVVCFQTELTANDTQKQNVNNTQDSGSMCYLSTTTSFKRNGSPKPEFFKLGSVEPQCSLKVLRYENV